MRAEEVDRGGDVWVFTPKHHKTEHHGKDRTIYIGPKAQAILAPYLVKAGDGYVFKTRRYRPYNADTYRRAIHRACDRAKVERWSPNRLRLRLQNTAALLNPDSLTQPGTKAGG
jgi:hypothetical protein